MEVIAHPKHETREIIQSFGKNFLNPLHFQRVRNKFNVDRVPPNGFQFRRGARGAGGCIKPCEKISITLFLVSWSWGTSAVRAAASGRAAWVKVTVSSRCWMRLWRGQYNHFSPLNWACWLMLFMLFCSFLDILSVSLSLSVFLFLSHFRFRFHFRSSTGSDTRI